MDDPDAARPRRVADRRRALRQSGLESGSTDGWMVNDIATLSTTTDAHSGSTAIAVTGRTTTGSGPAQNVTGKVQHGVTYDVSAWIKYDEPREPCDQAVLHHGAVRGQLTTFTNLSPATTVTRGSWGKVSGSLHDSGDAGALRRAHLHRDALDEHTVHGTRHAPHGLQGRRCRRSSGVRSPPSSRIRTEDRPERVEARPGVGVEPRARQPVLVAHRSGRMAADDDRQGRDRRSTRIELANRASSTWLEEARNTLSQRTFGPRQSAETKLDISGMKDGDVAGLAAYNRDSRTSRSSASAV